jgi:hypothetical protein
MTIGKDSYFKFTTIFNIFFIWYDIQFPKQHWNVWANDQFKLSPGLCCENNAYGRSIRNKGDAFQFTCFFTILYLTIQ